jgi:outer membrane lipoprotein-sorting protein
MRKLILNILLLGFSQVLFGQNNYKVLHDTLSLQHKIEKMSQTTKSLESDFVQVKNLSMLSEKITSNGHFWFQKPNNLKWEYVVPYKYSIVISNDKILIKDEQKTKKYDMKSNKVFKEINDILMACVNGDILKIKKFNISYFESDKNYKLELVPYAKEMKESLKKINMYFEKDVSSVSKLEMVELTGDITTIDFNNKKLNGIIAPEKFILK